jgi:hypothetical protein
MNHFHQSSLGSIQAAWVGKTLAPQDLRRVYFFRAIKVFERGSLWLHFTCLFSLQVHVYLVGDLAVSFDVTIRSVIRQVTNGRLSPLSSTSGSSQEPIWNVFTSLGCSWNYRLLWLHFSMLLVHVNSEVKSPLVGETTLSLNNLGSIFDRQNRSWLN